MPRKTWYVLDPGHMDRLIVIQTAQVIQGSGGFPSLDWDHATEQTVWAEWLPAGTKEAYEAQQRLASYIDGVFHLYDLNPRPAPDNTRVLFDNRIFDTKPWVEIGRGAGLELPVVARSEGEVPA